MAQTSETSVIAIIVSLALFVAGLAIAFGVELAREGTTSRGFELRRLFKGTGALLLLIASLAAVTRVDSLFPATRDERVVPPQHPKPAPPEPDRELFTVTAARALPWRIGVLDGYDGTGWLTPPFDTARLIRVAADGSIPKTDAIGAAVGPVRPGTGTPGQPTTVVAAFTVSDIPGHTIPAIANTTRVLSAGSIVEFDPRTQTLRLATERAKRGLRYKVEAPIPPRGTDLQKAPPPPASMKEFLAVSPVPRAVAELLRLAPPRADRFTTLQFLREKLYGAVVAKGAGQPSDVSPVRVEELLKGKPGTPYEITAAEALLARWAGVPSRIGYGYFGGDATKERSTVSIHPRHAATWLEAYFQGYGWVAIVGTPPRAQSSLSKTEQAPNPSIRPSENLTLFAYIPVRARGARLLYTLVQYWAGRVLPIVAGAVLLMWLYPGLVKYIRRVRRDRWAHRRGFADRILVAYAGFRDIAYDCNVGHPTLTPLEFLASVEPDREHSELAWLVTRALWGDLARDLRDDDAEAAEDMARSLATRLRAVQPGLNRVVAFASRASLRDPFSEEVPNIWWPRRSLRARARIRLRGVLRRVRRPIPATAVLLVLSVSLGACVRDVDLTRAETAAIPQRLVPSRLGSINFRQEPATEKVYGTGGPESLVGAARVFSLRRAGEVLGALQIVAFKRAVEDDERLAEARAGVRDGLGGEQFRVERIGADLVYTQTLPEQKFLLWFPPKGAYYELFIARPDLEEAEELFAEVLAYQRGTAPAAPVDPPIDPRRGWDG